MKIEGKLLEKLVNAGIEIEEIEKELEFYGDDEEKTVKIQIVKFPRGRDLVSVQFSDRIKRSVLLKSVLDTPKTGESKSI